MNPSLEAGLLKSAHRRGELQSPPAEPLTPGQRLLIDGVVEAVFALPLASRSKNSRSNRRQMESVFGCSDPVRLLTELQVSPEEIAQILSSAVLVLKVREPQEGYRICALWETEDSERLTTDRALMEFSASNHPASEHFSPLNIRLAQNDVYPAYPGCPMPERFFVDIATVVQHVNPS